MASAWRIAAWGAAVFFPSLLMAALLAFMWRPKDELARIRAKYRNRLVSIDAPDQGLSGAIVDVANMQGLAMVPEG